MLLLLNKILALCSTNASNIYIKIKNKNKLYFAVYCYADARK